jgi:Family of unknown function (DUF6516)
MKAELLLRSKDVLSDSAILEMVIWRLPEPTPGSAHPYEYRLFYGRQGRRVVGFDNERGKGDHYHLDGKEQIYHFTNVDRLIDDFLREVRKRRIET